MFLRLEEVPVEHVQHESAARSQPARERSENPLVRPRVEVTEARPHVDDGVEVAGERIEIAKIGEDRRRDRGIVVDAHDFVAESGQRSDVSALAARDVEHAAELGLRYRFSQEGDLCFEAVRVRYAEEGAPPRRVRAHALDRSC